VETLIFHKDIYRWVKPIVSIIEAEESFVFKMRETEDYRIIYQEVEK